MIEKLIIPLDYIILAVGCLIVIFCFWRGVTASILGLLTWLGSIIITIYFYTDLSDFINSQLEKDDLVWVLLKPKIKGEIKDQIDELKLEISVICANRRLPFAITKWPITPISNIGNTPISYPIRWIFRK